MPTENELEELTNQFLDDTIELKKGVDLRGKAEQTEVLGALVECGGIDCVSGKDFLQD